MSEKQPEALRLAAWLNEAAWHQMKLGDVEAAGRELRTQHADLERKDALLWQARMHVASNIALNSGDSKAEDLYDAITSELAK